MSEKMKGPFHLPTCGSLRSRGVKLCDCGQPPHPLPTTKELVRNDRGKLQAVRRKAKK